MQVVGLFPVFRWEFKIYLGGDYVGKVVFNPWVMARRLSPYRSVWFFVVVVKVECFRSIRILVITLLHNGAENWGR